MAEVIKDEVWYTSLITFQVDGCLFRVPRKPFETESVVFQDMFSLPSDGQEQDGTSDARPLYLDGVKKEDFRLFLSVLFTPMYGDKLEVAEDQWTTVLKLAHMWGFSRARKVAIEHLEKCELSPVRRIELANKYDVTEFYLEAVASLVRRADPLTTKEARRIGLDFALRVGQVRETRARSFTTALSRWFRETEVLACGCRPQWQPTRLVRSDASHDGNSVLRFRCGLCSRSFEWNEDSDVHVGEITEAAIAEKFRHELKMVDARPRDSVMSVSPSQSSLS